jgi:hypothetical protein
MKKEKPDAKQYGLPVAYQSLQILYLIDNMGDQQEAIEHHTDKLREVLSTVEFDTKPTCDGYEEYIPMCSFVNRYTPIRDAINTFISIHYPKEDD